MKKVEHTGKYISYLSRLLSKYSSNLFSKYDLSAIEYMYLMILHEEGEKTQKELSSRAMVDKAQTTRAVNSLLQKELISKISCKEDKRAFYISLSPKGKELSPSIYQEIEQFELLLNRGVSKEHQKIVKRSLLQMIRNMKEASCKHE